MAVLSQHLAKGGEAFRASQDHSVYVQPPLIILLEIVEGVQMQNLAQSHQNLLSHQGLLICWCWYIFFSGMLLLLSQESSS